MALVRARSSAVSAAVDPAQVLAALSLGGVIGAALIGSVLGHWSTMDVLIVASMGLVSWRIGSRPVWFAAVAIAVVAAAWGAPGQSFGVAVALLGGLIVLALNESAIAGERAFSLGD